MITYSDVNKTYGKITAVSDLNMEIQKGEFFGLLGPNGAGKTSIIRMTMALTPPNSGSIEIDGQKIHRDSTDIKQKLGIIPQYSNLEADLTAFENLEFHGRLYGLPKQQRRKRIDELLEFADLTSRKKDIARTFSGGMQRKLMIAKTLMHDPKIMLLDEPTVGLDATTRRKIWDFLRQLKENGLTIFMTTHYLEEAQALCERVGLIDEGKLIMLDSPERIIEGAGSFVLDYFQDGKTQQKFFPDRDSAIDAATRTEGSIKVRDANLEDVFIKLTNKDLGVRNEI